MNELDDMLQEDAVWYKSYQDIPVIGECDNPSCSLMATKWWLNTSRRYCGQEKCWQYLQREREQMDD